MVQERVYITHITHLALSTTSGCHNDGMIQLGPISSRSLIYFVQISDARFVLAIFSTCCNQ